MTEPAVLEPPVYEPVYNEAGERIGWKPSAAERQRFEQGSRHPGTGQHAIRPTEPDELPHRALEEILDELDTWAIGDERLYGQLRHLYERKPLVADRIARAAVNGAQNATLHDPSAYLASRLRPKK